MLQLNQFNYNLPEKLIAKKPVEPRDHSRLLVLNKNSGQIKHSQFYQLADFLKEGDILVRNNTKVIPARLYGNKETGGKVELLLSKQIKITENGEIWEVLTKPGLKMGQTVLFESSTLSAKCIDVSSYTRRVLLNKTGSELFSALEKIGYTPLPPYIKPNKKMSNDLKEKYQTLYAKHQGSAAAPTAGLHFTPQVEELLAKKGIEIVDVTLHVGLGTFLPVKSKDVTEHKMHSEYFELTKEATEILNGAKANGQRIIAVGTTTTRVLESCSSTENKLESKTGETDIFIYPGYKFKFIDGLITNFHLPKSTLLMLVSALVSKPNTIHEFAHFKNSTIGKAYQEAIKENYRFYSFGDAMLII